MARLYMGTWCAALRRRRCLAMYVYVHARGMYVRVCVCVCRVESRAECVCVCAERRQTGIGGGYVRALCLLQNSVLTFRS